MSETAGFLDHHGEQLYYVLTEATGPRRGGMVIAMPFAGERPHSYPTVVRWARLAAALGFDVVRFDYRGIGESTGDFAAFNLTDRLEDMRACAQFLRTRIGDAPLVLHGMRLGAVLASELFASGIGDGLVLWASATSAQDHLFEVLRFTIAQEMVLDPKAPRRTRDECIQLLENGGRVNVAGYFWALSLWKDSANRPLVLPGAGESRPWRAVDIRFKVRPDAPQDPHRLQVACARFWEEGLRMHPEVDPLLDDGKKWLELVAAQKKVNA